MLEHKGYKTFQITDFINTNSFDEDSIQNIIITNGNIHKERNQLRWNLNGLPSGRSSQLEYVITRNPKTAGEVYLTSENHEIRYSIEDTDEQITSNLTPILGRYFEITYEGNDPIGCIVQNIPDKNTHQIYERVENSNYIPVCKGYQFEGWKNVTEGVSLPNEGNYDTLDCI